MNKEMGRKTRIVCLLLLLGIIAACSPLRETYVAQTSPTTWQKSSVPPDSVRFDAILIQVPYADRELVSRLWSDVDEQELPWPMRVRLTESGFRVGLMGASVTESLSDLLLLKGRPLRTTLEETVAVGQDETRHMAISKPITLKTGNKTYIDVHENEIIPSIPVIRSENGQVTGKSYSDAQTLLAVSTKPLPDGSVQFEITPFLRFGFGEGRMVAKYERGHLVNTLEQPTKTFEELRASVPLRPGQFLVMGVSGPTAEGLGKYFFTKGSDDFEQKVLVIRLLVTQHDEPFERFADFGEIMQKERETRELGLGKSGKSSNFDEKQEKSGQ
ncbi:MAG: hypothetical protein Q4G68_01130 [Planctomycetia bacterium]|nr:hypothetical protein [Planctomycetia bacterium]